MLISMRDSVVLPRGTPDPESGMPVGGELVNTGQVTVLRRPELD
jgi:hypothetical protein